MSNSSETRSQRTGRNRDPVAKIVREFSMVSDFLAALTGQHSQAEVLVAPVMRPRYPGTGTTYMQVGVMLNAQRPGSQRIFSCIALAAEAILVGDQHIRFSYPPNGHEVELRQRLQDIQLELLQVLVTYLKTDSRVLRVRQPTSLWVPTTKQWNPNALLGLPLAFQDGHWRITATDVPS